ncbi:unnamed protein product [Phytomonas sp. Hart1]|nr:unnamed protein product [Phytomonas sp. Hart1]|eukprot:CCW66414.1 unnamed protein product [Phytomonas sp. isolate Hart1]
MELCDGNLSQRIRAPALPSHRGPSDLNSPSPTQVPHTGFGSIPLNSKSGIPPTSSVAGLTPIGPKEAVLIIHDIACGIAYLHKQGIIHRDIKPANILFTNDVAKLGDFGSAVRVHEKRPLTNMKGTLSYMAPEVILGDPYGKPCDMWSFGCVLADIMGLDLAHVIGLHIPALIELYGSLSMDESLPVTIANLTLSRLEDVAPATTSRGVLEAVRAASTQAAKERDELGSLFTNPNTPKSTPEKSPFPCTHGSVSEPQVLNVTSMVPSNDFSRSRGPRSPFHLGASNGGGVDYMTRSCSMSPQLPATLPIEDPIGVPLMMRHTRFLYEFPSNSDRRQPHPANKGRFDPTTESSTLTVARTVICISINKNSIISTQMVSLPRSLVELLESLFHRDPAKRMTIEELLEHPVSWNVEWMTNVTNALQQVNESIMSANNAGSNPGVSSSYSLNNARLAQQMGGDRVVGIGSRGNAFEEKLSLSLNSSPLFVSDDAGTQKV